MDRKNVSVLFMILVVFYITLVIISNIVANRLILIMGIQLTGAVMLFPLTYILGDIFTEVYGFKYNKLVIVLSFICNIIMVICFAMVLNMPYPDTFSDNEAFMTVLGTTPRILVGSLLGFLVGSFLNSLVLSKLKVITKGKNLPARIVISTIVGEATDTAIFILVVFLGNMPNGLITTMIVWQTIVKILIEVIIMPVTYHIIKKIKKIENKDAYDNIKHRNLLKMEM